MPVECLHQLKHTPPADLFPTIKSTFKMIILRVWGILVNLDFKWTGKNPKLLILICPDAGDVSVELIFLIKCGMFCYTIWKYKTVDHYYRIHWDTKKMDTWFRMNVDWI